MSKLYTVTIYPVTPWKVTVEADSEEEAQEKALGLEAPPQYAFDGDPYLEEWQHEILEWPNIGNGIVHVEEVE